MWEEFFERLIPNFVQPAQRFLDGECWGMENRMRCDWNPKFRMVYGGWWPFLKLLHSASITSNSKNELVLETSQYGVFSLNSFCKAFGPLNCFSLPRKEIWSTSAPSKLAFFI